jgi:hypothetical protein
MHQSSYNNQVTWYMHRNTSSFVNMCSVCTPQVMWQMSWPGMRKLRPAGQMRPATVSNPARERFCGYIYIYMCVCVCVCVCTHTQYTDLRTFCKYAKIIYRLTSFVFDTVPQVQYGHVRLHIFLSSVTLHSTGLDSGKLELQSKSKSKSH